MVGSNELVCELLEDSMQIHAVSLMIYTGLALGLGAGAVVLAAV